MTRLGAVIAGFLTLVLLTSCGSPMPEKNAGSANQPATENPGSVELVPRPEEIIRWSGRRGDADKSLPDLTIMSPKNGERLNDGASVSVGIGLGGELKGFAPRLDPATKTGDHILLILDNQTPEKYFDIDGAKFVFPNVSAGNHLLRAVAVRPWGESFKNDGAMALIRFSVGDTRKAEENPSETGFDPEQPVLTLIHPLSEAKSTESGALLFDFSLHNARLKDRGGDYRVRYRIDGGTEQFCDASEGFWLRGIAPGVHKVTFDLLSRSGRVVPNGGINVIERTFTVIR